MFKELLPLLIVAENILRGINKADSLLKRKIYNTRRNVHLEIGNLHECEADFKYIRAIIKRHCSPNHPLIANILNNQSAAATALENYHDAKNLSLETISIREKLEDPQYTDYKAHTLPINRSNLCRILYMMGEWARVEAEWIRALDMAKDVFGLWSKNTAQLVIAH